MTTIKENGAPTKHTVGAIGDIYDDTSTGKRYSCESVYSDSVGNKECEWREIEQTIDADPVVEDAPEDIPDEEPTPESEPEKSVEEKPVNNQQYNPNRNNNRNGYKTQYNKQYRPNNK